MELITRKHFNDNVQGEQDVLDPFRWEHVQPLGIDLTVGRYCHNLTMGRTIDLDTEESLEIRPGDSIIIDTDENLRVPSDWFGILFPKASLMRKGLAQTEGKVDPGFRGLITVVVRNAGYEVIKLKRQDPICCVAFWRIQ